MKLFDLPKDIFTYGIFQYLSFEDIHSIRKTSTVFYKIYCKFKTQLINQNYDFFDKLATDYFSSKRHRTILNRYNTIVPAATTCTNNEIPTFQIHDGHNVLLSIGGFESWRCIECLELHKGCYTCIGGQCYNCSSCVCKNCGSTAQCLKCSNYFCMNCSNKGICKVCYEINVNHLKGKKCSKCERYSSLQDCKTCGKIICFTCTLQYKTCYICKKNTCEKQLTHCIRCNVKYCENCVKKHAYTCHRPRSKYL